MFSGCFHDEKTDRIIAFTDTRQNNHADKCKSRDIEINSNVSPEDRQRLREDIAVDIALNQGHNPVGIRKDI